MTIKVSSLNAITRFLASIEETTIVLKYKGMMEGILDVVINVL